MEDVKSNVETPITKIVYNEILDADVILGKEPYMFVKNEYDEKTGICIEFYKTESKNVFYIKMVTD